MPNDLLRSFLLRLLRRESLACSEAASLLDALLAADATEAQIAGVLVALAAKGETADELQGMTMALRARALRLNGRHRQFVDTAGTGSSRVKTFNISTAAAFVIAGAGLPVAKHGNRSASSQSGSADVLTALGVNVSAAPQLSERCFDEIGVCFMFAPLYHGATARVASVRRELGIQTTFNLLGPLSNPAGARRQVIGVANGELTERLAQVLLALGTERAWVVHGSDGLDEITLDGLTAVAEAYEGALRIFEIEPADFGLTQGKLDHLRGGDPAANALIIREVLAGTRRDEARNLVVINAAAGLFVGGHSEDYRSAAQSAAQSIDSGAAHAKLEQLVQATNA